MGEHWRTNIGAHIMISRISVRIGKRGMGNAHREYIEGTGAYATRDDVVFIQSGNMPSWATDSKKFWATADEHERANGQIYKEHVLSLPRGLSTEQHQTIVNKWIEQELGDKHPYTYAIHAPIASDDIKQPHAHLMYSERMMDGIDRDEQQFFKRANKKNPERGGAVKANTGLSPAQMKKNLYALRERWGEHLREHLREFGLDELANAVDMRNWRERGLSEPPQNKTMAQINMEKRMDMALKNHPYYIETEPTPQPVETPRHTPKPTPEPEQIIIPPVVELIPVPPFDPNAYAPMETMDYDDDDELREQMRAYDEHQSALPAHEREPEPVRHAETTETTDGDNGDYDDDELREQMRAYDEHQLALPAHEREPEPVRHAETVETPTPEPTPRPAPPPEPIQPPQPAPPPRPVDDERNDDYDFGM